MIILPPKFGLWDVDFISNSRKAMQGQCNGWCHIEVILINQETEILTYFWFILIFEKIQYWGHFNIVLQNSYDLYILCCHEYCLFVIFNIRWYLCQWVEHNGPASHAQNTVQPMRLHLRFASLQAGFSHPHSNFSRISSGVIFVPGTTVWGFRTDPSCSHPWSFGQIGCGTPDMAW